MIENHKKINLAIIGLGYVGLPLALEFAKKRKIIGFDINDIRIKELNNGYILIVAAVIIAIELI